MLTKDHLTGIYLVPKKIQNKKKNKKKKKKKAFVFWSPSHV